MKILYITYIDFGDFKSGSSVRPQMMYHAFQTLGCEIKLLQTQQNRRKERCAAVKEINRWLKENKPDICYVESPSGPIFQLCDLKLLKRIKRAGIPIGYFYRDAAYKFDNIFVKGKKTLKQYLIAWMSQRDVRFLNKTADLIYFPTISMAKYFPFKQVKALPPACVGNLADKRGRKNEKRCIYVGGVSKRYGSDTLLQAFDKLNPGGICEYSLTLVCREREVSYIPEEYLKKPWLTLVHTSGKENLAKLYEKADLALYPIQKNEYNDFAFSVKLMEYMEFGLPVVAVNCEEAEKFIVKYSTGLTSQDNPEDFAAKIRDILLNEEIYDCYTQAVYQAVQNGNCWKDRAQCVVQDLKQLKNSRN